MDKHITVPMKKETVATLKAGDYVYLTGTVYTARDAAHKRMLENLHKGIALPVDLKDQTIYFAGPAPAKPNEPIGSVGPTTSYRMDAYSPETIELGLTCMIGKGARSKEVVDAMKKYGAVYIGAVGGAGAGDVKLSFVLGVWLGFKASIVCLMLAFVFGGIIGVLLLASGIKQRKDPIPFGPFLCIGAYIALLFSPYLIYFYWNLFV